MIEALQSAPAGDATLTPLPENDYLEGSLTGTKWINLMAIR